MSDISFISQAKEEVLQDKQKNFEILSKLKQAMKDLREKKVSFFFVLA